ncbi:MAG: VWA domain-containing protein, partial [Myxococcota bacterium]|nr:VWA domain-containing protein [Myxococcota bacterium]
HNGQSMMDLWMLQGDSHNPLECATLGHFEFFGLSPKPAKESQISITYRYTHNGIVEVEARDLSTDNILSHRLSGDKYSLQDVLNGNIPAHIAVIMDCSGSMYGEALDAAKVSTNRFIEENIRSNRSIAIFTSPGGTKPVAGPHNDPRILSKALNELVAIGSTDIAKSILIARRNLKEKGTIFIILSDGIVDDPSAVERACNKVRKQGGRIFCIGVGPNVNRAFLQKICASKEDYADAYDPLSISHALNNIITQVD